MPKKRGLFITSKFRSQEIKVDKKADRLWIEILNTSYSERLKIKNKTLVAFFLIKPENLKVEYEAQKKKDKNSRRVYLRTGVRRGRTTSKKRRPQRRTGGFLSRYDFAYAGRYTVNQVGKITPAIIKQATGQIDKNAQDRINQVIRSGGAEVERLLPKIICRAIEDVYKTPFRLLGNLGKQQFQKIKKNIKKY